MDGVPPSAGYTDTNPGRVRTPPGKNSTSRASGDIPGETSDASSSVIHDPNVVSGIGAKVSTDICACLRVQGVLRKANCIQEQPSRFERHNSSRGVKPS